MNTSNLLEYNETTLIMAKLELSHSSGSGFERNFEISLCFSYYVGEG